tara:strand:+ start:1267 stop:1902 length:636 start_codon:yes stop_codon:yes gene_type:complete
MGLKLITTDKQFTAKVFSLLAKKIDPMMLKAVGPIQNKVQNLIVQQLASDPIIDELRNGKLALDFGLSQDMADRAISEMLEGMRNSVSVSLLKGGKVFSAGFSGMRISIDPVGPIQNIPAGSYDSNGHNIEWMDWLLTRGSQVVVSGFESVFAVEASNSRSGLGFMLKSGGSFRVDPRFSGTKDSNFLTRIVIGSRVAIEQIIKEEINKVL